MSAFSTDEVMVRDDLSSIYENSYNVSLSLVEMKRLTGEQLAALPPEPDRQESMSIGLGCLALVMALVLPAAYAFMVLLLPR